MSTGTRLQNIRYKKFKVKNIYISYIIYILDLPTNCLLIDLFEIDIFHRLLGSYIKFINTTLKVNLT